MERKPASSEQISLSQAILAPLDAVFKAQIHAARSYINMLWQMAYPHVPVDADGKLIEPNSEDLKKPYSFPLNFNIASGDETRAVTMEIPTIAMIPVTPLGIEEATIKFSMAITGVADHTQLQASEIEKHKNDDGDGFNESNRPWYLVKNPQSLRGDIVASGSNRSSVEVNIKLTKSPIPAALEKSLTVLTQSITVSDNAKP